MVIEGIEYRIKWLSMERGESFFIPCLNFAKAKQEISKQARLRGFKVLVKGKIENNLRGLRVWRL